MGESGSCVFLAVGRVVEPYRRCSGGEIMGTSLREGAVTLVSQPTRRVWPFVAIVLVFTVVMTVAVLLIPPPASRIKPDRQDVLIDNVELVLGADVRESERLFYVASAEAYCQAGDSFAGPWFLMRGRSDESENQFQAIRYAARQGFCD